MEVTRVMRPGVKAPVGEQTVVCRTPGNPSATLSSPPAILLPLERLALVALVFGRDRAAGLLEGLTASDALRAGVFLSAFAALSSARRQARVAVEFGVRPEAGARLRAVMEEAPEALRKEIFRRLPPYHRSLFPGCQLEPSDPALPVAVGAWAERLVREATR